jgi:hypothetical protein
MRALQQDRGALFILETYRLRPRPRLLLRMPAKIAIIAGALD